MSKFLISNLENYNKELPSSYDECVSAFKNTIYKYILHYNLINQEKMLYFDINTLYIGIEMIECVFLMLLLKTKNLQLVIQNSENTIFYFFEFIEQMNRPKTELHALLNLTIHDAKLFVYKKTIYDIQVFKNTLSNEENNIFCRLKKFTLCYKHIINMILKVKTINEIIENFETLDEYMKNDLTDEQIDMCLSIDIENISDNNLYETLDDLLLSN